MQNLRWILATEAEWQASGLGVPNGRKITIDTPSGAKEYILQHYELQSDSDEKYEVLMANMPNTAFVSNRALQWILPEQKEE